MPEVSALDTSGAPLEVDPDTQVSQLVSTFDRKATSNENCAVLQDLLRSIGMDGLNVTVTAPVTQSTFQDRRRGPPGSGPRGPPRS